MLSACSSKPPILYQEIEKPVVAEPPIEPSLLVYDEQPEQIADDATLNEALAILVSNHRVYAEYIIRYRALVDAINRRNQ